ncbi:MAG: hypothetical protein HUK40_15380 [Desulfobacter sp.]|nr:hypothetical protein [Desulfobacter sp.]
MALKILNNRLARLPGYLERISSGLKISKADDGNSKRMIADALNSQTRGLGQAIKNTNDGISIVQITDAALEETVNILNTVKAITIQRHVAKGMERPGSPDSRTSRSYLQKKHAWSEPIGILC